MVIGIISAILDKIMDFTPWFNKISVIILLIYTGLVIIIYFICIFTNIYRWISKLKDKIHKQQKIISKQKTTIKQITSNRDGLLTQFKSDKDEKEDLINTITKLDKENQNLKLLIATRLPTNEFKDMKQRIKFLKENNHNDSKKYKSSKNHQ